MKTNFLKLALLALSVAAGSASAEIVHTIMPSEFYANGKVMPAGMYTVKTLPGAFSVVVFINDKTSEKAIAFARTTLDVTGKSGTTYELSTTPRPSPLKGTALALTRGK